MMTTHKHSTIAERLATKIEHELSIKCDPSTFKRTYAGRWQKANGAWVWRICISGTHTDIGSCDTASDCIKTTRRLTITNDGCICAEHAYIPETNHIANVRKDRS